MIVKCVMKNLKHKSMTEKYLGDIVSKDDRNIKHVKARINKGKGIVSKIMSILETIPLGRHYFEIAVVLRNSLLTSSMLCNTESWYNITKAEMNLFETIDEMLLRRILGAPRSTAKEMLYLELGCLPYREMVRKRRLMFLKYILHEKQESMIYKFLEAQIKNPTVKDWVTTVRKDLHELNLSVTFAEIKKMKKGSFKTMIRKSIAEKAL